MKQIYLEILGAFYKCILIHVLNINNRNGQWKSLKLVKNCAYYYYCFGFNQFVMSVQVIIISVLTYFHMVNIRGPFSF